VSINITRFRQFPGCSVFFSPLCVRHRTALQSIYSLMALDKSLPMNSMSLNIGFSVKIQNEYNWKWNEPIYRHMVRQPVATKFQTVTLPTQKIVKIYRSSRWIQYDTIQYCLLGQV